VDWCGFHSGRNCDKFKETGLTPLPAEKVLPPLIAECPLSLECELRHFLDLGSHGLFIGEIINVDVDKRLVLPEGGVDIARVEPLVLRWYDYVGLGTSVGFYGFSVGGRKQQW